ncbi:MAG: hypothetical protein WCJ49_01415, partial [Deltaproteobacteria bacterium]
PPSFNYTQLWCPLKASYLKFRWGPDNFTDTLWEILQEMDFSFDKLLAHWQHGIRGINNIKDSFRTITGKLYGPDFVDRGLKIGETIFTYVSKNHGIKYK